MEMENKEWKEWNGERQNC